MGEGKRGASRAHVLRSLRRSGQAMMGEVKVLLVEDNPADVDLTREGLRQITLRVNLSSVGDGVAAMQFLRREGQFQSAPRPDLILLDLNLPKRDGRDVLADIKRAPDLRRIPVVVLTSSAAEQDILTSYDLGANCYITKPIGFRQFQEVMLRLEGFWFTVVRLPRE